MLPLFLQEEKPALSFQVCHVRAKPAAKGTEENLQSVCLGKGASCTHSGCCWIQNKTVAVFILVLTRDTGSLLDALPRASRGEAWSPPRTRNKWSDGWDGQQRIRGGIFEEGEPAETKLIEHVVVLHLVNPKASRKDPSLSLKSASSSEATSWCLGSYKHTDHRAGWLTAIPREPQRDPGNREAA